MTGRRARAPDPALADLANRLHSAAIHLLRSVRRQDEAAGLTPARLSALSVVVFRGELTLGELAAAEQVRPPTITRLVAALEQQGLVVRATDSGDQRIARIRATAAGRALLMRARARRVRVLIERIAGLGAADLATLSRAADLMEEVAREE